MHIPSRNEYCMYFMTKDESFFDKYIKIWEKSCNLIKKNIDIKLIYNKKDLKAKNKSSQKKAFTVLIYQ